MTTRTLLIRTILRALLYGCFLWSAVMIGASSRPHVDTPVLGEIGSAALPEP